MYNLNHPIAIDSIEPSWTYPLRMSCRHTRILLPYLAPRSLSRPFFSLPNPFDGFSSSSNDASTTEDGMQRYHERKIMQSVGLFLILSLSILISMLLDRYSRKQLFDLVADVDSYHHFIPF